jgi:hypothetical protein
LIFLFMKNVIGVLMEITLNKWIVFSSTAIFTILKKDDFFLQWFIVFHYIGLSLPLVNLFLGILIFWYYCEWYCFPDFILGLFIVYKNVTDFRILILYPATLLNICMHSKSFLGLSGIIWLLPSLFEYFLFLSSVLLLWHEFQYYIK